MDSAILSALITGTTSETHEKGDAIPMLERGKKHKEKQSERNLEVKTT